MTDKDATAILGKTLDASETLQNVLSNAVRRLSFSCTRKQQTTARLIALVTKRLPELSPEARVDLMEIVNDLLETDQQQAEVFGDVAESMESVYRRLLT